MIRLFAILVFTLLSSISMAQLSPEEEVKRINGANLFFNIRGKGDHLLVVHGGPGLNHAYFIPHLSDLEKKFKVIYYDQRACGRSSIPASDSISMKFLVDDIEAIRKGLKIEKLNVLVHSWGAVLVIHYALRYPDRINKIILSNPAMLSREYDEEAAAIIKSKTTKEDSVTQAQIMSGGNLDSKKYEKLFLLSFGASAYDKSNVSKIKLGLPDNFSEANNALFSALMKDSSLTANLYDSLKSCHFPVLIIHGEADVIPVSAIERLRKGFHQADLEIFKQSGHFPFVEEPRRYSASITRFLNSKK